MKKYIVAIILVIGTAIAAFAAKGDKPNQMVIPFRNVSSSVKPAGCTQGEMRQNADYVFFCATSAHWRRITKGSGF